MQAANAGINAPASAQPMPIPAALEAVTWPAGKPVVEKEGQESRSTVGVGAQRPVGSGEKKDSVEVTEGVDASEPLDAADAEDMAASVLSAVAIGPS